MFKITNKKGFTLTELMIVIAIIGIFSAVTLPGYFASIPKRRLKASAKDISSAMNLARLKAVSRNINHGVFLNNTGATVNGTDVNSFTVFTDNGTTAHQFDANDSLIQNNIHLNAGITITVNNFTNDTVIFLPDGTAGNLPGDSGLVTISNGSETRSISVLLTTGRISIQ